MSNNKLRSYIVISACPLAKSLLVCHPTTLSTHLTNQFSRLSKTRLSPLIIRNSPLTILF